MKNPKITIAIPVYNTTSTLPECIKSIKKQTIKPIQIIFIDNKSKDGSIMMIKKYQQKEKEFEILLLTKEKTSSVASSFNMALAKAKGGLFLTMHSDSSLPSRYEIQKLISPLDDTKTVACYSYVLHPKHIWEGYNFWEKCQSCRVVNTRIPAMNGKFDCYRIDILRKMGGFDELNFDEYGDGLDADIYYRLKQIGEVAIAEAEVVHLHYLKNDYRLYDWILKRRNMSITAGRLLKMYKNKTDLKGIVTFSLRPILAILPFIPAFHYAGVTLLLLFSILYTRRMFITWSTVTDPRILALPVINIFLVYYESFWILSMLLTHKVKKVQPV